MGLMVLSYIFSKLSKLLSVFIFIISIVSFALYITSKYIYISHEFKISIFVVLCILFFVYFTKTVLSLRYKKILEYIEKDLSIEKGSITGFVDYKKNKFFGSKELADEYVRSIYEFIVSKRKFIVKKNVKQILYLSPLLPISLLILLFVSEQGFSIRRQSFYDIFDVIPQDKVRYVDKFSTVDFILKPKIKKNVVAVVDGKKFNGEFDGSNYFFKFEAYKDMEIVFFAGVYSDKYKIKVLNEVGFEAIAMVYPPSYTGISPYTLKNSFFLNVPEGSSVKYTFDFTDNIESVKTSYGNVSYLGRRLIYEKIITNDIVEDIIVKPVASSKKVIKININAIKDNPPFARIVSPKSGVYAGEISRIPIIYEYEDDYKVVAAELFIVNEYVNLSKKLKAPVKKAFDEEFIELGTLKGEYVDIYIAIKDDVNPIVYSDKVRINIISKDSVFRKQFEDIKRIEDKVMELLSDEIEVEKYINDMNFQEAFRKQQSLDLKYADFVDTIEKGNFNMPFMNDILNSIKNIKDIDSKELLESISRNDFIKSKEQISDIITQLEKMTHNLTNIKKEFNLSKMLEDVSDAKKLASSISVSNDLEEIKELVKKIFDRFNSVMEKIKNMPALLPEDFVNRYDAAKLDFSQAMNKMNELMSALSSGNLERIKELANELLNELENLEKSLSSIAQPTMELSHILNRINDIIAKEKTIADDTYKLKKDFASSYKEKLLKMQSSTYEDFKKIVKTQKEQEVKSSMLKTIEFIKTENFTTAKNEVETILERLKDYKYRNFYVKELEVYELLNSSVSYAAKLKAPYLNNLSMKQHEIMKDTLRLKNEVEDVFSKAILPPDIHTRLKRAANYMDSASKFLKIGNIDKAYQDELNALKELIEASKRNYSAASGSMGGAVGATSRPGFYGIRIDEVKFPRKEDYKKPYQLRDEILNSLKERKPEESKEFIEKYFEELIR